MRTQIKIPQETFWTVREAVRHLQLLEGIFCATHNQSLRMQLVCLSPEVGVGGGIAASFGAPTSTGTTANIAAHKAKRLLKAQKLVAKGQ